MHTNSYYVQISMHLLDIDLNLVTFATVCYKYLIVVHHQVDHSKHDCLLIHKCICLLTYESNKMKFLQVKEDLILLQSLYLETIPKLRLSSSWYCFCLNTHLSQLLGLEHNCFLALVSRLLFQSKVIAKFDY